MRADCGGDWTKPLFDIAQMRRISYPLPGEEPTAEIAEEIKETLLKSLPPLSSAKTPVFELPGYADEILPVSHPVGLADAVQIRYRRICR